MSVDQHQSHKTAGPKNPAGPIFHSSEIALVGFSGSGKTTLLEKLASGHAKGEHVAA